MTDKILLNSTNGKMLLIQMNLSLGIHRVPLDITITSRKGSYITVMSLISLALTLCSHASSHPFAKSRSMISKVSGTVLHQHGYKLASYSLHCTHHGSPDQPEIFSFNALPTMPSLSPLFPVPFTTMLAPKPKALCIP